MSTEFIFIANAVATLGIFACFFAYADIGVKDDHKLSYRLYLLGTTLLMASSVMLKSLPTFWLNLMWFIISLYGYYDKSITLPKCLIKPTKMLVPIVCLVGLIAIFVDYKHLGAFMTSTLYLLTYFLFTAKLMSKRDYYAWCMLGIIFVTPLLLHLHQYAVFGYEVVGVIMSLIVIIKEKKRVSIE